MAQLTDKQRQALARGREKGIKRKPTANKADHNNTFAAIFHFIESCQITDTEWALLNQLGITKEKMRTAGITDERKLKKCVNIFVDDSPATVREYLQRSEPQDNFDWLLKLDLDKLPPNVIEQIANANDIRAVIVALASAGEVGATGA